MGNLVGLVKPPNCIVFAIKPGASKYATPTQAKRGAPAGPFNLPNHTFGFGVLAGLIEEGKFLEHAIDLKGERRLPKHGKGADDYIKPAFHTRKHFPWFGLITKDC